MAYNALNNLIDAYIYANGVQAITGQILNGVLKQMVSQLGSGYHLMGVAGPKTVPASNDFALAYFAATAGEYTDFGGITIAAGEVAVLLTSGNGSWEKQTIYNVPTGTADLENTAGFITNEVTDLANYYTKTEIDGQKAETDAALAARYTKTETDTKLAEYYKKTETYDKDEVDSIIATLNRQEYIVAWDGLSAPDVSAIPAGVTVSYSGTTYTGTLTASASTVNKIYMVWNGTAYDMYGTSQDGGYSWIPMGTTTVDLSQYATKTDVSAISDRLIGFDNSLPLVWEPFYINLSGEAVRDNTNLFSSTGFIAIKEGYSYILNGVPSTGSIVNAVSFYGEDYEYISGIHYSTYSPWVNYQLTIPQGAKYLRLCKSNSDDYQLVAGNSAIIYAEEKISRSIKVEYIVDYSIKNAYIDKSSGNIVQTQQAFAVSSKFYIGPGKTIILNGLAGGSVIYSVAFYDEDDVCLGGIEAAEYYDRPVYTPADTVYVRFCNSQSEGYHFDVLVDIDNYLSNLELPRDEVFDLQSYIDENRFVQLPAGTFIIDSPLIIPSGTKICGVRGSTIIKLGNAANCVSIINKTDVTIEDVTFEGSSAVSPGNISLADIKDRVGEGSEVGILINGDIKSVFIRNCRFINFDLAGIRALNSSGDLTEAYKVTDCIFKNNWYGLLSDVRSEYNTIIGCSFNMNEIGAFVAGGNNNFSCCHFDRNAVGYVVSGTAANNDSHGVVDASTMNHSSVYSICCIDANNGFIFSGCNIFEGDIDFQNSKGILFNGCEIAAAINQSVITPGRVNMIANSFFHKSYGGGTINDTTNLILKNNHFIDGSDSSAINN